MPESYPKPAVPGKRPAATLLLDERPLLVLPSLATALGLNEAIVVQQLHYWLRHNEADPKKYADHYREGRWWSYNTVEEWQVQFPFWSTDTIQRTMTSLKKKGVVLAEQFGKAAWDRTMWYTIDYERLEALAVPVRQSKAAKCGGREPQSAALEGGNLRASNAAECGDREPQLAIVDGGQSAVIDGGNLRQTLSETSSETSQRLQQQEALPPSCDASEPQETDAPVVARGENGGFEEEASSESADEPDEAASPGDAAPEDATPSPPEPLPDAAPYPQEMLLAELMSEGMGEAQARAAARDQYDMAVYQLANLRHALPGEKILPSRGGWLHLAITRPYGHTKGYAQHLETQKGDEQRRVAHARREAERLARAEAERVSSDEAEADLTPDQEQALRQRARNAVHPDWRKRGEAGCARLIQARYEALLRGEEVTEFSLWPAPGQEPQGPQVGDEGEQAPDAGEDSA